MFYVFIKLYLAFTKQCLKRDGKINQTKCVVAVIITKIETMPGAKSLKLFNIAIAILRLLFIEGRMKQISNYIGFTDC